jgi:hypothetical protein
MTLLEGFILLGGVIIVGWSMNKMGNAWQALVFRFFDKWVDWRDNRATVTDDDSDSEDTSVS